MKKSIITSQVNNLPYASLKNNIFLEDKKHKPQFTKKPSSKRVQKKLKEMRAN